jgi:hypothetical protein
MTKPSRTTSPRRPKNEKLQASDPLDRQDGHTDPNRPLGPVARGVSGVLRRLERRDQLGQRERERERRVSDADASYYGPICGARTHVHAMPMKLHAKLWLPHRSDPAPSPMNPQLAPAGKPVKATRTRPIFSSSLSRGTQHPSGGCHYVNNLIPERHQKSTPLARFF